MVINFQKIGTPKRKKKRKFSNIEKTKKKRKRKWHNGNCFEKIVSFEREGRNPE